MRSSKHRAQHVLNRDTQSMAGAGVSTRVYRIYAKDKLEATLGGWYPLSSAVVCREGWAPSAGEVVYLSGRLARVQVTHRPEPGSIKFKWPDYPIEEACAKAVKWFTRKTEGREDVL